MLERYNETIASDSTFIEVEHLWLALLTQEKGLLSQLPPPDSATSLARNIRATLLRISNPPKNDVPISDAMQRVFKHATEPAAPLMDVPIGPKHLLLALLQEPDSPAIRLPASYGLNRDRLSQEIAAADFLLLDEPVIRQRGPR
jgi:ATP-dependent Clp protease ATP-binding subunit ClpA